MKKVLSLLLSFAVLLTVIPYTDVYAADISWEVSQDGTLTVTGTGAIPDYSAGETPWNSYNEKIKNVVIGDGITRIGSRAFNELHLQSVAISGTVTSIGYKAFAGNDFAAVDIPDSVTLIDRYAFHECANLTTVKIGKNVTTIGECAFTGCTLIDTVIYSGTESQWQRLTGETNPFPASATIIYGNTSVDNPDGTGSLHSITAGRCENGTVNVDRRSAAYGETVTVTADAATGHTLSRIFVDGQALTGNTFTVSGNHTVSAEFIALTDYTVSLDYRTQYITDAETANVDIKILSADKSVYNAVDITLNYTGVTLVTSALEGYTLTTAEDSVRIQGYGSDKSTGTTISLQFNNPAAGGGTVQLVKACVDESSHAISADAPEAQLGVTATSVVLKGYTVQMDDKFIGDSIAQRGAEYVFTAKDLNYNYSFTATAGGKAVAVTDNGDGTFTISNVDGPLVIAATATPKIYSVKVEGNAADDVTAGSTATYGTDYSFTVAKRENYSYNIAVEISGKGCSYSESDGKYTIRGADITGEILITVDKIQSARSVEFRGSGAGAATGENIVSINENYSFTLTKTAGYSYEVEILMGGQTVTPSVDGDKYTINNVTADLIITIECFMDVNVNVSQYLKLNNATVYLVRVTGDTPDGYVISYDGNPMYRSAQYGCYVYLVISDRELTSDAAEAAVGHINATTEETSNTGDVNNTGTVDINDAQLVYDIYNTKYSDFSQVSMKKFLCADINGDFNVNVDDAVRVVSKIG